MTCHVRSLRMHILGSFAWVIVVSSSVAAQTVDRGLCLMDSSQRTPSASPQQSPDYAPVSCVTNMALNKLVKMNPCELERLYARGCLEPIPAGKVRGQALLNPGTALAVPSSRVSRIAWQGKIFHEDGQTAINRFFGMRLIRANVYNGESWRDGRPALILDYSQTSLLYAPYRDEIRQIAPGLYLGLMFDRNVCPPKLKMYFALECEPQG